MDYREFACAVNEQVNYMMSGGVKAQLYTAVKNNGTERTGVLIEAPGINISPTIYLEDYYEDYRNGQSVEKIAGEIIAFYDSVRQERSWDCQKILTYAGVRDKVVFKLINTAQNRAFLRTVPHIDYLDLSIVFYVLLEITEEGTASMAVTEEHVKRWGVSAEQLWENAAENVKRLLPAEFFTMNYALKEILKRGIGTDSGQPAAPENLLGNDSCVRDGMYVLSNSMRNYGAACIVYPHILEMIWNILQTDYYVLPSSVHEVIITPCHKSITCEELDEMIQDINETQVDAEEVLSNHAYLYEHSSGRLHIGLEKRGNAEYAAETTEKALLYDEIVLG